MPGSNGECRVAMKKDLSSKISECRVAMVSRFEPESRSQVSKKHEDRPQASKIRCYGVKVLRVRKCDEIG